MAILTLPDIMGIERASFGLESNTKVFSSSINKSTQTARFSGARWTATYRLVPHTLDDIAEIQSFLVQLRGRSGRFYAYDPLKRSPRGTGNGNPVVDGDSQTGTSLDTTGWAPNETVLRKADYVQIGDTDELKMVTQDIISDGSGNATLVYEPPIRTSPLDQSNIIVHDASAVMLLAEDKVSWEEEQGQLSRVTIKGVEALI
jgi:hypothetical protein